MNEWNRQMSAKNQLLDHAVMLAAHGWLIIPTLGKIPCGNEWHRHATNDPAALTRLFHVSHHDGFGVQLGQRSGIVDFDADSEEAEATFQRLFGGDGPTTPTFQSARGRHRFFQWSDKLPSPDKIKFVLDGLEVRTGSGDKGAQTVLPPSGERRWIVPPNACEMAEIPADVIERINARWAETHKPRKPRAQPAGFVPTNSDSDSLDVPRWLRKHGREIIGRTEGSDGVTRWHIECPGIDQHTTENSFRDCCVTQGSNGVLGGCCFHATCGFSDWPALRSAIGELEYSDFHADESTLLDVDLSGISGQLPRAAATTNLIQSRETAFPAECLHVGGIIERIVEQNLSSAMYPMPELALAGALALMSVITGRKVQDRRQLRTNGYYLGLAAAGAGKNFARQLNAKILYELGEQDMVGPSKLKSSAGLVNALVIQPACLFQLDEISRLLQTMKNPKESPHLYDIGSVMLEAYSEANTTWKPGCYADSKKNPIVEQPHLVIYGTAVPKEFWASLTVDNMTDGLLGRMMVFEFFGLPGLSDNELQPLCSQLLAEVRAWLEYQPAGGGNLKKQNPIPTVLQYTAEAWDRYLGHTKAIVSGRPGESPVAAGVWRRTAEKTGKLAILSACSRQPPLGGVVPTIELCDVDWGIRVSNWLTRCLLRQAGLYVAENQYEDSLKRILRMMPDWTSLSEIRNRVRWLKPRDRNELLNAAVADGLIEAREVETDGRKRSEYRSRGVDLLE